MTLFHFGNCLAMSYVPYFIVYRYSALPEYNALWKCLRASMAYLATQALKMIVLATFFPPNENLSGHLDYTGEAMKASMDFLDLVGLLLVIKHTRVSGQGDLKILAIGLGWGCAELVGTQLLPLWVQARGLQFSWSYVQQSLDSNISLIHHISTAAVMWLWSRTDLNQKFAPLVIILMTLAIYRSFIFLVLGEIVENAWLLLAGKFVATSFVGLIALSLYLKTTSK